MIEAAAVFGLGSIWTLAILSIGYRRGYESGRDDAELEVTDILLEDEITETRRERERLEVSES